jgi:superfamily I DNA/RNA helicase
MWQLDEPRIEADFILFDEAQDANPVMKSIVEQQTHAQVLWVGDSCQAIYEWNGAVNALERIDGAKRCFLTNSFRFGPAIAEVANRVLDALGASPGVVGLDSIDSTVGPVDEPDVVLCRTNAAAVDTVMSNLDTGRTVALVGGAQEVVTFAEAAVKLQNREWTPHPELSCFTSWPEVVEYVAQDQQGHELALLVGLVEEYGAERIIAALDRTIPEAAADIVVSTAHKAKGREWGSVRLAADFPDAPDRPEELRLVYVAATRARNRLSAAAVPFFSSHFPRQEAIA